MVEHAAVNRDVEGSSPSSGAISNCLCSKEIKRLHRVADTKTDTQFTTPPEFAFTGVYSPTTR